MAKDDLKMVPDEPNTVVEEEEPEEPSASPGMTILGYTEASRIEDSHIKLEAERRALERKSK